MLFPAKRKVNTQISFQNNLPNKVVSWCCGFVQSLNDVILYKRMIRHCPQKRTNNGFRDTEETPSNKDADN